MEDNGGGAFTVNSFSTGTYVLSDAFDGNNRDNSVAFGDLARANGSAQNVVGVVAPSDGGGVITSTNGIYYLYSKINTPGTYNYTSYSPYNFCFLSGVHITTSTGEVLVEDLKIGDVISTYDGGARKVLWIGRQVKSRFFSDRQRYLPVEIAAGALGDHLPLRPLRLSPDHAILVNGSMRFMTTHELADTFTYYHIEIEDHALILPKG